MNEECLGYVAGVLTRYPQIRGCVLEVGSYNVNGTPRGLFTDRKRFPSYWGIDMRSGPDVDQVCKADRLPFLPLSFEVIVCTEMLEHDDRFWESAREFVRVLVVGGHVILTTRNVGYEPHDYPQDYFRFTVDGIRAVFDWAGLETLEAKDDKGWWGTYAVARKSITNAIHR